MLKTETHRIKTGYRDYYNFLSEHCTIYSWKDFFSNCIFQIKHSRNEDQQKTESSKKKKPKKQNKKTPCNIKEICSSNEMCFLVVSTNLILKAW